MITRNQTIDIAKGISIILVVFGHSEIKRRIPELNSALGLFRMPLFFFLSGVFFRYHEDIKTFILRKSDALLKPYLVTLLVAGLVWNVDDWSLHISKIVMGTLKALDNPLKALWFLNHLWLLFMVAHVLFKFTKLDSTSRIVRLATVSTLFILGLSYFYYVGGYRFGMFDNRQMSYGLPFSADILIMTLPFFISGSLLKEAVTNFKPKVILIVLCIGFFLATTHFFELRLVMSARLVRQPFLVIPAIAAAIYFILSISYYFSKSTLLTQVFLFFGTSSLFILLFHGSVKLLSKRAFYQLGVGRFDYRDVVVFILAITIPVLMKKGFERIKPISWLLLPFPKKKFVKEV